MICLSCEQPIEPFTGIIIHGNLYGIGNDDYGNVRTVGAGGGIVGNAFPNVSGEFKAYDVDEYAFHTKCLFQKLEDVGLYDVFEAAE
jgi:hypothetical protein